MKQFSGFKAEQAFESSSLPAGGYVAKILGVGINDYDWGSVLVLMFDICEGDYTDFWSKQYKSNDREDKKWKGTYRLTIPKEGSQYYDSNVRLFNNAMWAVEESNTGYHWNWNENGLQGKMIGVIYRNREYDYNGYNGWTTECGAVTSVANIRSGNYKIPKDRPIKRDKAEDAALPSPGIDVALANMAPLPTDEDLPF